MLRINQPLRHVRTRASRAVTLLALGASVLPAQAHPLKVFVSVDMEGIGGVGTAAMANDGKDYQLARRLATEEVNAVVAAIYKRGPAEVLVNDSHGDMQNLLHTDLDPRVTYIQGSVKLLGMVEGLDSTFDAAIFLGYHARAGTPNAFLAHTGVGVGIQGIWLGEQEVGEGELNAAYAREVGVPVVVASGDSAFVAQFTRTVKAEGVTTKTAITPLSARLIHPQVVRARLAEATTRALDQLAAGRTRPARQPVRVRMRFGDGAQASLMDAIPGVVAQDATTIAFSAPSMYDAYRLVRFIYRFTRV